MLQSLRLGELLGPKKSEGKAQLSAVKVKGMDFLTFYGGEGEEPFAGSMHLGCTFQTLNS